MPPKTDSEWAYNVGREALLHNFNKYTNILKKDLGKIYANYGRNNTRLTQGEFVMLITITNEPDYMPLNINYQLKHYGS